MGFYPFEKGDIKKSGYICTPFLDNRRQTERNQVCLNCRGAKEEKTAKRD